MSAKEYRQKSAADLQKELLGLRREQFNLRMARATGQSTKPDQFSKVRRNIARLKTVMGEQRRAGPAASVQKSPTTLGKGK
jgi:large subunit ribosomal protein L29